MSVRTIYAEMKDHKARLQGDGASTMSAEQAGRLQELEYWMLRLKGMFIDFDEDVLARSMKEAVVVDFYTTTCPPCQRLAPLLDKIQTEKEIAVVKIDGNKEHELCRKYQVRGVPRVLIFHGGNIVWDNQAKNGGNEDQFRTIEEMVDVIVAKIASLPALEPAS
jgi:thioredoxin-like negative regulator of GroEL